jgi:hypothetical protein
MSSVVLASELNGADGEGSVLRAASRGLQSNPNDLPFTVTYLFDADGVAHVAGMANVAEGSSHALGALLVGLNPYRAGDTDYLSYLSLLAGQISSSLSGARAWDA